MKGYKGFDKNWSCREKQYEVGKTYTHDGDLKLCNSGIHFCEAPLDVWTYYPINYDCNYALVEANGVSEEKEDDTKRVAKSITIKAALTIRLLIAAQVEWTFNAAKDNAVNGSRKSVAASGNYSTAASSGNYSTAACDTKGFACVAGISGRAKGGLGSALSLGYTDAKGINRIAVGYVGEDLKAGVWYCVKDGKLTEAK